MDEIKGKTRKEKTNYGDNLDICVLQKNEIF